MNLKLGDKVFFKFFDDKGNKGIVSGTILFTLRNELRQ